MSEEKKFTSKFRRMTTSKIKDIDFKDVGAFVTSHFSDQATEEEKDVVEVINILSKKYRNRTQKENAMLYQFLTAKTKLNQQIKNDLLECDIDYEGLFFFISQCITPQVYRNDDNIYLVDDKCESFYIILYGSVDLLEIIYETKEMTADDYYLYLDMLSVTGTDDFLLAKLFEMNQETFPIKSISDIRNLEYYVHISKLLKLTEDNDEGENNDKIKELYQKRGDNLSDFEFDKLLDKKINNDNFVSNITKDLTDVFYFYNDVIKMNFDKPKSRIRICAYKKLKTLEKFDYFGNFDMSNEKPKRAETAKSDGSTLVLVVNKKAYTQLHLNDQKKAKDKEFDLLYKSYFFGALRKSVFTQCFFENLEEVIHNKGTCITTQGTQNTQFLILKKGSVEVSLSNCNLAELRGLIGKLKSYLPRNTQYSVKENFSTDFPSGVIEKNLAVKRKYLISIIEKGTLFGDYEMFYNIPSIFTSTVTTEKAVFYSFSYEQYNMIKDDVYLLSQGLKKAATKTLKNLIERLIFINNSFYKILDNEYKYKLSEENNLLVHIGLRSPTLNSKSTVANLNTLKIVPGNPLNKSDIKGAFDPNSFRYYLPESFAEKKKNRSIHSSRNSNLSLKSPRPKKNQTEGSIYLPIVTTNNTISTRIDENEELKEQRSNSKKKERVYPCKFPPRIVQNVPLINRLNYNVGGKYFSPVKERKVEFMIKPDGKKEVSPEEQRKKVLSSFSGGYYMAVQQFISQVQSDRGLYNKLKKLSS